MCWSLCECEKLPALCSYKASGRWREREREIESERLGSMDVIRPYAGERERETENDRERERVRVRNTAREGSE